jgi:hypothetical protein
MIAGRDQEREEIRLYRRRWPAWWSLMQGLGLGLGVGLAADLAPRAIHVVGMALCGHGPAALGVGATLALLAGFFFETSPPRVGS